MSEDNLAVGLEAAIREKTRNNVQDEEICARDTGD